MKYFEENILKEKLLIQIEKLPISNKKLLLFYSEHNYTNTKSLTFIYYLHILVATKLNS